jgi:hypothetical protein
MPVLAMFASQIAARTGKAKSEMTGDEVVERSFFNGTNIHDRRTTIDESV